MSDKTWKARERQVAKLLGTERTPLSGGNGKQTRSDSLSQEFFVECKHRRRHAVLSLYDETSGLAGVEGKLPLVVLTEHRREGAYALVPLDVDFIRKLLGQLQRGKSMKVVRVKLEDVEGGA